MSNVEILAMTASANVGAVRIFSVVVKVKNILRNQNDGCGVACDPIAKDQT